MSLFTTQFQVVSDLHLETPIAQPLYKTFQLRIVGSHVFLLGDISLVVDGGLFDFLRALLEKNRGCRFCYVLGNHEPYGTTLTNAVALLWEFGEEVRRKYGGRFVFLNRDRFDVDATTTILGCTLWSDVLPGQASEVCDRLTDFHELKGIRKWSLEKHLEKHRKDRDWLNSQIREIEEEEPKRRVIIATHYSPILDPRAVEPAHQGSSISSAFATDMSNDLCWTSTSVKLWAFGHTHYNCGFRDEATGKLVVANQRGHGNAEMKELLIEPNENGFDIITPLPTTRPKRPRTIPAPPNPVTTPSPSIRALSPPIIKPTPPEPATTPLQNTITPKPLIIKLTLPKRAATALKEMESPKPLVIKLTPLKPITTPLKPPKPLTTKMMLPEPAPTPLRNTRALQPPKRKPTPPRSAKVASATKLHRLFHREADHFPGTKQQ
ncbi:hypothetical protein F4808DRAFT_19056 [Astrocystis sublimbata]|nr:hypothetical protein F4808DRAFT_19056 [Astrocystis sublimbata]